MALEKTARSRNIHVAAKATYQAGVGAQERQAGISARARIGHAVQRQVSFSSARACEGCHAGTHGQSTYKS
jgi:hypothetical protein